LETDPDDNLCLCLNTPINPLKGAKNVELDRGQRTGIRVAVKFLYHCYAPAPLNADGIFDEDEVLIKKNPLKQEVVGIELNDKDSKDSKYPLDLVGSGSGNGLLSEPGNNSSTPSQPVPVPKTQNQLYWEYRALMEKWKQEAHQQRDAEENAPFKMALGCEKPVELNFRFESLSVWSNERVFSLHTMFRAQEQIDKDNTVKFFRDNNGQPGQEMDNEILADLIEVENEIDLPELVVTALVLGIYRLNCFVSHAGARSNLYQS
jgi:hypothetical protein